MNKINKVTTRPRLSGHGWPWAPDIGIPRSQEGPGGLLAPPLGPWPRLWAAVPASAGFTKNKVNEMMK